MAKKRKTQVVEEIVEPIEEVVEQPIIEEPIVEEVPVEEPIKDEPKKDTIDQILIEWRKLGIKDYPREGMIVDYKNRQWKIIRIFMPVVVLHRI